ncbi:MAG: beta-propeller fold lactonase family protein [Erysipelotrichaceae bacterium]|nr:beta-propeller fold lactonase family protein [Erysipelotrichaceae bacterium]
MKPAEIMLCAYGNHQVDKGIVILSYDKEKKSLIKERVLSLAGKCNLVSESEGVLYLSVKYPDGNKIELYDASSLKKLKSYPSEYFYSYGQVIENKFLLASYESGVDSVFDFESECFVSHCVHQREGMSTQSKSHYIQKLKDGQIIGIENGLQQMIVYKNMNLEIERIIEYPPVNIRLLAVHPDGKTAYMNTEFSNELIVLNTSDWSIQNRYKLADHEGWYSGGNAISSDGKYVCVSIRGEDVIHVFVNNGGCLHHQMKFCCGKTPRDLMFVGHDLFVTCTNDNKVEVYDMNNKCFKVCEAEVNQPITFKM